MNPFPHGSVQHHVFELLARGGAITPADVVASPEFAREVALRRPRVDCSGDPVVVRPEDAAGLDLERLVKQVALSGQGIPGPGRGELVTIDQRQSVLDAFLIQARVGEYAAATESALRKAAEKVANEQLRKKEEEALKEQAEFEKAVSDLVAERRAARQKAG